MAELYKWLKNLLDGYSGIPGGFQPQTPRVVMMGGNGSPGNLTAGWMAADAQLVMNYDVPVAFGNSAAAGSATKGARADHVHPRDVISAGTQVNTVGTVVFSNANSVSFGMSDNSVVTASIPAQSNQTLGLYASSQTTGQSSSTTADARSLTIRGAGNVSVGFSGGELVVSATGAGGGGLTAVKFSAGTLSSNRSDVTFANSNGVSFGLDTNGVITASAQALLALSAGTTRVTSGEVVVSNSNGVSFGVNGQTLTASVKTDYLTTQSGQAFSADASSTFQTLTLQNSNGISFSNNAGAVRLTHALQFTSATSAITSNALHSSASRVINIVAATNNTGGGTASLSSNVSFSAANGLTFYTSAGNAVVGSYTVPAAGETRLTAYAVGNTTQSSSGTIPLSLLSFQGAGVASVGVTNGSVVISVPAGGGGITNFWVSGGTTSFAISTVSAWLFKDAGGIAWQVSSGAGGALSLFASNSMNRISVGAGASTAALSTMTNFHFLNSNGVSFGLFTGAFAGNTTHQITASIEAQSIAMHTSTAGGGTGGTSGSATGPAVQYVFYAGSNITLSQSINGASGSLSIYGPTAGGGGGFTAPGYHPYDDFMQVVGQVGQGTLQFDPQVLPNVSFDRIGVFIQNTNASNSSGSHTLSFWVGLFTRNAQTLSRYTSFSGTTALTHSGTVGSYSLFSGGRLFTFSANGGATSISEGKYWIAFVSRTTSGGANGSYSNYMVSNIASQFTGVFGVASNATMQPKLGQGYYTATTSGIPTAIQFAEINGTNSLARRMPVIGFHSSTA